MSHKSELKNEIMKKLAILASAMMIVLASCGSEKRYDVEDVLDGGTWYACESYFGTDKGVPLDTAQNGFVVVMDKSNSVAAFIGYVEGQIACRYVGGYCITQDSILNIVSREGLPARFVVNRIEDESHITATFFLGSTSPMKFNLVKRK